VSLRPTQLSLFGSSSSLGPSGSRACSVPIGRRARPVRIVGSTKPNPLGSLGSLALSSIKPAWSVRSYGIVRLSHRADSTCPGRRAHSVHQGRWAYSIHQGSRGCLVRISHRAWPVWVVGHALHVWIIGPLWPIRIFGPTWPVQFIGLA